jgi:D-alanyl-D-alanine carboxypeptidase
VPGIQYVVVDADRVVFEYAGGWADIRGRVPLGRDTTMMAYSMSKTITAVAVLQLVGAGNLGLDDSVERYVDGPYGPGVTIRRLLSHTSGVPNPIPLSWVHAAADHESFDEGAALRAVLRDHPRLSFEPGTRYGYSNIGYWLLGKVVERASGASFTEYVAENILRRLAIPSAALAYVVSDQARHATGYLEKYSWMNLAKGFLISRDLIGEYAGRWLEIRSHYPNGPAFGGLVGTAHAFGTFLQDQLRPRSVVLDELERSLLYVPEETMQGTSVPMTLGWHVADRSGRRYFYKEGGGGGFHSLMRLYPEEGIGTVVMTNATGFNVHRLLDDIDRPVLGRRAASGG